MRACLDLLILIFCHFLLSCFFFLSIFIFFSFRILFTRLTFRAKNRAYFRIRLEQIEKRRAEVNEEMTEIVNRFEAATESLQPSTDTLNDNAQNNPLLEQSSIDNHMDQSEDDSYYQNNFKSAVSKRNDESLKHGNERDERDESSNDDTTDESGSNAKKSKLIEIIADLPHSNDKQKKNILKSFSIIFQYPLKLKKMMSCSQKMNLASRFQKFTAPIMKTMTWNHNEVVHQVKLERLQAVNSN